jgi:hypothetical protein
MSVVAAKSYIEYRNETYWIEGTRISLDSIVDDYSKTLHLLKVLEDIDWDAVDGET